MMQFLALKKLRFLKDLNQFDQFNTRGAQCALPPGQTRYCQTLVKLGLREVRLSIWTSHYKGKALNVSYAKLVQGSILKLSFKLLKLFFIH